MLQSRIFVGMVLILIFGEVLGLYGQVKSSVCESALLTEHSLITGLILTTNTD